MQKYKKILLFKTHTGLIINQAISMTMFLSARHEMTTIRTNPNSSLAVHDGSDEVLVVDVSLVVLVTGEELLGLLVTEFFPEGGEKVPQLRRRNESIPVLVEVAETLDEVLARVSGSSAADGLHYG